WVSAKAGARSRASRPRRAKPCFGSNRNVVVAHPTDQFRAGLVGLGGRSNVGKSTLLNLLVGYKVAIVTPLPQTTRRRILGIRNDPDAQLILIDMPGIHESRKMLNQRMVGRARACLK